MQAMRRDEINVPVIIQTASSSPETIVSAMRYGASDYFVKPVEPERLTVSLQNALKLDELESCIRAERARNTGTFNASHIITKSAAMDRVFELIRKSAKSNIPVLIEGETGVGKELVARAIQGTGERAGKPFITVNCGALPANLVESTLFGHVKGAFTGATGDHIGKFEEANGGTLFLDEVGELALDTQVKLLRAIQEGEIEPVGSSKAKKINVRLISATNRRLLTMAKNGTFREDLFYRLNVFPIYVPPLRDRLEDIVPLAEHFATRFGAEVGRRVHGISAEAMQMLHSYNWPGNIRQLENALFRAVVLADELHLQATDFPQIFARVSNPEDARSAAGSV
jgi:DNA-binding NtrC family response regulator